MAPPAVCAVVELLLCRPPRRLQVSQLSSAELSARASLSIALLAAKVCLQKAERITVLINFPFHLVQLHKRSLTRNLCAIDKHTASSEAAIMGKLTSLRASS